MAIRAKKEYAALRNKLPAFVEEPEYQQLVDKAKQELLGTLDGEGANIHRLASLIASYEKEKDDLYGIYGSSETTDAEYEINIHLKALSQLMTDACEDQNLDSVTLTSGVEVGLESFPVVKILDKTAALEWAFEEMPELLTLSFKGATGKQLKKIIAWASEELKLEAILGVHTNTLNALVREKCTEMAQQKLKSGSPLPPWAEVTLLTRAKVKSKRGVNRSSNDE